MEKLTLPSPITHLVSIFSFAGLIMEPVILTLSHRVGSSQIAIKAAILALLVISLSLVLVRRVLYKIAPPLVHQSHESLQCGKYKLNY